jgi:hypothetical protein
MLARCVASFLPAHFFHKWKLANMTTTETLEGVDNIVNMLDEIMDHMDGFSSAEEEWLSSITETLRTWRYVMRETYESGKAIRKTSGFLRKRASRPLLT